MKISKAKYEALKRGTRRTVKGAGKGMKANGVQVLAGAITAMASGALVKAAPQMMSFAWWAEPAALVIAGILARRSKRLTAMGDAVLGAAGYAGVISYRTRGPGAPAEAGRLVGVPFRPRLVSAGYPQALPMADAEVPVETRGVRSL
jgi:hypothetical protein